ncbi:MAG: protein nirF [Gammaproteobacteria bacterium]|nr:protein nirF [Gammaproteobacteria bacterium]MCK5669512.1 protein nirF [Gammaproteobacteria bacterium]
MNFTSKTILFFSVLLSINVHAELIGTGDLGIVIERAIGQVKLINTSKRIATGSVEGLGDLSHASAVFSRDARYAFVFGRDGGLTKLDLLTSKISKRIIQAGNSIGGAISQDGKFVAVSNYEPGGVRIFDSETLELAIDIPAEYGDESSLKTSKVIGLVDAPGQQFVFSLYDAGEIWLVDINKPDEPIIRKFKDIGIQPYDALITPDGRYYIAGLYGENGLAVLDLWNVDKGVKKVLIGYGRDDEKLPVYKMPHLEGWAKAGDYLFVPAIGQHAVIVIDPDNWQEVTRIKTYGQPVFAIARPDGRQVWVNFAFPNNDHLQIIDVAEMAIIKELIPGKAVLHMEFTSRGEEVWVSVRDEDRVDIYDTESFNKLAQITADKPSGIFFTHRAHKIGL